MWLDGLFLLQVYITIRLPPYHQKKTHHITQPLRLSLSLSSDEPVCLCGGLPRHNYCCCCHCYYRDCCCWGRSYLIHQELPNFYFQRRTSAAANWERDLDTRSLSHTSQSPWARAINLRVSIYSPSIFSRFLSLSFWHHDLYSRTHSALTTTISKDHKRDQSRSHKCFSRCQTITRLLKLSTV